MAATVCVQAVTADEVDAQLGGKPLTAVVFFLDETFEEMTWGMSTTVADAVVQLAGLIKLTNFETFTLFESRKVRWLRESRGILCFDSEFRCADAVRVALSAQQLRHPTGCNLDLLLPVTMIVSSSFCDLPFTRQLVSQACLSNASARLVSLLLGDCRS